MAKYKWYKSKLGRLFYRKHNTRKHGVKFDRYFRSEYQHDNKRVSINFGWASQGWSELKCLEKLNFYMANAKDGVKPISLKEEREISKLETLELEKQVLLENQANMILSDFWVDYYVPFSESKKSWAAEKSFWKIWIKDSLGKKRMNDITIFDLEKLQSKILKKGNSQKTANYILTTIRQVYNRAINSDMFFGPNPVSKIKFQKINNQRVRFLDKKESVELLSELEKKSQQVYEMTLLSLHTGMRAGELFKLKWHNVNIEGGIIQILDTKNTESRHAYMSDDIKEMLNNKEKRYQYVFVNSKGKRIQSMSKTFSRVVDGLGFNSGIEDDREKVVFHTMRHTFASWQVQAGMNLYVLQNLMGHKSFQMVQRYAHLAPKNLSTATAIFNKKLSKSERRNIIKQTLKVIDKLDDDSIEQVVKIIDKLDDDPIKQLGEIIATRK